MNYVEITSENSHLLTEGQKRRITKMSAHPKLYLVTTSTGQHITARKPRPTTEPATNECEICYSMVNADELIWDRNNKCYACEECNTNDEPSPYDSIFSRRKN